MAARICLFVFPLLRCCGSETFQAGLSSTQVVDSVPIPVLRQLILPTDTTAAPVTVEHLTVTITSVQGTNPVQLQVVVTDQQLPAGTPPVLQQTFSNEATISELIAETGGTAFVNGIVQMGDKYLKDFTAQQTNPDGSVVPVSPLQIQRAILPATPGPSTTLRWRGMMVASSGSDPFHQSWGASTESSKSSSGIGHSRASQWSSSYSGSGSGWLYPWDYKNLPWVHPYWPWWKYFMIVVTCACSIICCILSWVCIRHFICDDVFEARAKNMKRNTHTSLHHHHHRHHDDEVESDDSEDLESDPDRRHKGSVSSSTRPSGHTPQGSYHGSGHAMPMGTYHPQRNYAGY